MKKSFILLNLFLLFGISAFGGEAKIEQKANKILVIESSPLGDKSISTKIGEDLINSIKAKNPTFKFKVRNLSKEKTPSLTQEEIFAFYTPTEKHSSSMKKAVKLSNELTNEFLDADIVIIESPMWNFSISSNLKAYIDKIVRVGLTFSINEKGEYAGLVKNKKLIIVSSRGGEYSSQQGKAYDFQNPYLKTIFGFLGIEDIEFITSEGIFEKDGAKRVQIAREKAQEQILKIVNKL